MADVFMAVPGSVGVFHEPDSVILMRIRFPPLENKLVMLSGVDYKQSVDTQFQTSLERDIYAYVFGDNMGDIALHGRIYQPCRLRGEETSGSDENGIQQLIDMYAENRMSQKPDPVQIDFAERWIKGYLTALIVKAVGLSDEPSGLVYDFSAVINTIPSLGNGGGSGVTSGS